MTSFTMTGVKKHCNTKVCCLHLAYHLAVTIDLDGARLSEETAWREPELRAHSGVPFRAYLEQLADLPFATAFSSAKTIFR